MKATQSPETVAHTIDFGPRSLNGIGPFTDRNLDSHGVGVIVVGDQGKGDAELYSIKGVKFEQSWTRK